MIGKILFENIPIILKVRDKDKRWKLEVTVHAEAWRGYFEVLWIFWVNEEK